MVDTWAPEKLRGYAFTIAYRMLGSVGEAEDIVQEAMIRLHATDPAEVRSPTAYTATVTSRLALDELRSARVRRERYVGTWLPEPVLGEPDPAERVVLETLGPVERAVFVLHDLFDLPYSEVATVVDRSEATCRQIAARARRHVAERRQRFDPPSERRDELVRGFFAALDAGDVAGLEKLLAEDVVFVGDGGGKAPAVKHPIDGTLRVARFLAGLARQGDRFGLLIEPVTVNGSPGLRVLDPARRLVNVLAIDFRDGRVAEVRSIVNPDKMRHLGPVANAAELLAGESQPGGNAR